jgi:hypothetical protein
LQGWIDSFDPVDQAFARKLIAAAKVMEREHKELHDRHAQTFEVIIQSRLETYISLDDGTARCALSSLTPS